MQQVYYSVLQALYDVFGFDIIYKYIVDLSMYASAFTIVKYLYRLLKGVIKK